MHPDEDLLDDLLLLWEERHESGIDTSASELAPDRPDLVPELDHRIQLLKASAWLDAPLESGQEDNESQFTATRSRVYPSPQAVSPKTAARSGRHADRGRSGPPSPTAFWLSGIGAFAIGSLLVGLLPVALSKSTPQDGPTSSLMARADADFFHARYADAEAGFSNVLDSSPGHYRALVSRGISRLKLGKLDAAVTDFTAALRVEPTDHEVLRQRAQANIYLQRYEDAVTDLELAAAASPDAEQIRLQLTSLRAARDGGTIGGHGVRQDPTNATTSDPDSD